MRCVLLALALILMLAVEGGCASAPSFYPDRTLLAGSVSFNTLFLEINPANARRGRLLRECFVAGMASYLPGVSLAASPAEADLVVSYQESDVIICVDCGDLNGSHGQDWGWSAHLSRPVCDPVCGGSVRQQSIGMVWGSANKALHNSANQLLHFLRALREGKAKRAI